MNKLLSFVIIVPFVILSCHKIKVPNEDAKKIFGQWNYKSNSGGFSGSGGSSKYTANSWVEFTEKGCFIVNESNNKSSKKKFKIEMINSIFDSEQRPAIIYSDGTESYQIFGDTLLLSQEAYDGYSYLFTKR